MNSPVTRPEGEAAAQDPSADAAAASSSTPTSEAAPTTSAEAGSAAETVATTATSAAASSPAMWRWLSVAALAAAAGALALAYQSGQQQRGNDAEFAKRQQATSDLAAEARLVARQADAAARDSAARVALLEARLAEVSLQRTQLEELIQALSRSRDENLLADLEAALRVAQQQVAITGSAEPMLAALKQADERLARVSQPKLDRVRRSVLADIEKVKGSASVDIPSLGLRIDELVRQVDDLPLLADARSNVGGGAKGNDARVVTKSDSKAVASPGSAPGPAAAASAPTGVARWVPTWLGDTGRAMWAYTLEEVRGLLRVTRVDHPEAALAAPEQAFFIRENLKLRLLNARLGTLSRQFDGVQSDLREAEGLLLRYFDRNSRRVDLALTNLRLVAGQARAVNPPRPEATLAALATALR